MVTGCTGTTPCSRCASTRAFRAHGILSNLIFHPLSPIPAAFPWTCPGAQSRHQCLSSTSSALRPKPALQTNILTRPHLVGPLHRSHVSPSTQHEKKPSSRSTCPPPLRWTVVTFSFRPTTRRYVGLPSFPSPPSSHKGFCTFTI